MDQAAQLHRSVFVGGEATESWNDGARSWCVVKVWIAAAISRCVFVVHFHNTERVKAPVHRLAIPLRRPEWTRTVTQRIIHDNPNAHPRHQRRQDLQQQQATDFVPVPRRLTEQPECRCVIAVIRLSGRFPNATDRAAPNTG